MPFAFTFRLWPAWLLVNGLLLGVFAVWDRRSFAREVGERPGAGREALLRLALGVDGAWNFGFLAALVAVLYAAGNGAGNPGEPWPFGVQEGLLPIFVLASLVLFRD